MKKRHRSRASAFQILYLKDVQKVRDPLPEDETLEAHFDSFQVPTEVRDYALYLARNTQKSLAEIDSKIESKSANWRLERMALVDRNILRLAIYELLKEPETPSAVIIDEAVELAKQYGTEESPAFINGVLDALIEETRQNSPS
jgi:N utilization substance protein B